MSWFASINEGGTWSLLMCSLLATCKYVLIGVGPQQSTPLEYSLTLVMSLFCGWDFAKGRCRVVRLERNYYKYYVKKIPKVSRLVSEHGHRVKYNIFEGFYISVSLKMQMLNVMSLQGDQTIKKEKNYSKNCTSTTEKM